MTKFGVVAQFEFLPGKEDEAQRFFQAGQLTVEQQPAATRWYAYRSGSTTYGAFAAFASEADRDALLASGGPRSSAANAELFARSPSFEKVEIVAARVAG